MLTMKKGTLIVRIKDEEEKTFLNRGYNHCPKQIWKDEVRVIKKKKEEIKENLEAKTTKRGKKSKTPES